MPDSDKKSRLLINIATYDPKMRKEIRKHLNLIATIREKKQDEVLLEALKEYLKKISVNETKF